MIEAVKKYVENISELKDIRQHQLTVALDLFNAFNSAWRLYISERLKNVRAECAKTF